MYVGIHGLPLENAKPNSAKGVQVQLGIVFRSRFRVVDSWNGHGQREEGRREEKGVTC